MLKLRLQYFGHLMRTADSLEKPLMLGKVEGREEGDRGCIRLKNLQQAPYSYFKQSIHAILYLIPVSQRST